MSQTGKSVQDIYNVIGSVGRVVYADEMQVLFCTYARKSKEVDECQAFSIDSQLSELKAMFFILQTRKPRCT